MSWLTLPILWYVQLLLLGIIFFPLTFLIFNRLFKDKGYAFAKTIAIILISYSAYVIGTAKIAPFTLATIYAVIFMFIIINTYVFAKYKIAAKIDPTTKRLILFEELLFALAFISWVYIRGQEPSLRGLEKFMDYGFIKSILRTDYFPPLDMWFSGSPINYYYFGHLTAAVLTKLTRIAAPISYNLMLASIFALSCTETFSLGFTLIQRLFKKIRVSYIGGLLAALLTNLGGNLHTIYAFTKGYANENPVQFWKILSKFNPASYWYPNATRFIPFTIHEFPLYSYVVADLHGHVFDIPFILLTIALLYSTLHKFGVKHKSNQTIKKSATNLSSYIIYKIKTNYQLIIPSILLGFMISIHYMTNAFNGLIYLLFITIVYFWLYFLSRKFILSVVITLLSFLIFNLPFSSYFTPFAKGIGVNCAPQFLVKLESIGPFLFEAGNCQISEWWMLLVLWGFFIFNFIFFLLLLANKKKRSFWKRLLPGKTPTLYTFVFILFALGTALVIVPEFFYMKDIYPAHFRANTMFKLGYQAFIFMSIASAATFIYALKTKGINKYLKILYMILFIPQFFLVVIYPSFAIPSYYGTLEKTPSLDGTMWLNTSYPEYKEVIGYLNSQEINQPNIVEAQGDSYTEYDVVSAYTGLPTITGWYVHEWLWRGGANVPSGRAPDIEEIYKGDDLRRTMDILSKYKVRYIIVGPNETQKYININRKKIEKIGKLIFTSSNGNALIYKTGY